MNAEIYNQQGIALATQGMMVEAIAAFRHAISIQPLDVDAHYNLGVASAGQGDLEEAIACFRSVLDIQPNYLDAWLNLAVVLTQLSSSSGEALDPVILDETLTCLQTAIEIQPDCAEAYFLMGNIFRELDELEQAIDSYNRAISFEPKYASAYINLGVTLIQQKRFVRAIAALLQAIAIEPNSAIAYCNLGDAFFQQEKYSEAIAAHRQALSLQPDFAIAHCNLGAALFQQSQIDEAISHYQQAISCQSDYAEAHWNLGVALMAQRKLEAAIISFQKAIRAQPDYANAYSSLGGVLFQQGRLDESIACYEKSIAIQPNLAAAYASLCEVLSEQARVSDAIACIQKAIEIEPTNADFYYQYGKYLGTLGKIDPAIESYKKALKLNPDHAAAYRMYQLILPIIYETEVEIATWRQSFVEGLQCLIQSISLITEVDRRKAYESISCNTNFYLAYQGRNDVEMQRKYGELVCKVMSANYPQWSEYPNLSGINDRTFPCRRIRIGYISAFLGAHAGTKMALGWLRYRDRERFEVYSYFTGKVPDSMTPIFAQESDYFRHICGSLEEICQQIHADRLDVLVFTDIGMHPQTNLIAALRLAPVQCNCWGNSITSGLPTIDYYLSSELMEPANAQSHYTETLVCLPKLGFSYPKPVLPQVQKTRAEFNLPEDAVIFASCQSLYKYLPQHDFIFPAIAKQLNPLTKSKFVFLTHRKNSYVDEVFHRRLQLSFSEVGLNYSDYCIFLPRMGWNEYMSLYLAADVFLDTMAWSGGNTALEAIACNLPIVTLPGEFMRGRNAYGILQALGVTDTVATSEADYIEIAVKLALDLTWRSDLIAKIQSCHSNLYEDKTCVLALEEFYQMALQLAYNGET